MAVAPIVPVSFGLNGNKLYSNISKPIEVFCSFVVDSTNGNGLGIRSLKSNGAINNVFMHTSATVGSNNGFTNPNPAVGYIVVQFKNNFNAYVGGFAGVLPPPSGSALTSVTAGGAYIITSLGTATTAQWQALGTPVGDVPGVGQAFIAATTGSIPGSGTVKVPGVPTIQSLIPIGDPNQTLQNSQIAANGGAQVILQLAAPTSSSVTTLVATAPADGSVVSMCFRFDGSAVTIDGL